MYLTTINYVCYFILFPIKTNLIFVCRDVELDSSELGSLPDGWEIRYTANGRRYFVNHLNRTTQFTGILC